VSNDYQILRAGERFAEERDHGHQIAEIEGVGTTYRLFADNGGTYFVSYRPSGPASLRPVIMREHLSWCDAMDELRDAVAEELRAEGCPNVDGAQ
jgi:hypothetical protein